MKREFDGDFIERIRLGKVYVSENDMKEQIEGRSAEDLKDLLVQIYCAQGESLTEPGNAMFSRLQVFVDVIEAQKKELKEKKAEKPKREDYPEELIDKDREQYPKRITEEGKKRFDLSIEKGFIDRDTREWKRNKTALGWWISDMKAVGGIVKKERNHWSLFEKYFGYEKVQHAFDNAKVNETCPDYDDIGPEVFPERYESNGTHKNDI